MKPRVVLLAGLLSFGLSCWPGQATIITFDGPPAQPPGTQYAVTSYSEAGMNFTPMNPNPPGNQFLRNGGGLSGYPDDGTPYLQSVDSGLIFSLADGSPFGLSSVDLAGFSTVVPYFNVDFVGSLSGGGTISQTFSGTGINFQNFQFGSQWTGLTSVEVFESSWSMDNLVVTVPEPGVGALFALGTMVLAFSRRREPRPHYPAPCRRVAAQCR